MLLPYLFANFYETEEFCRLAGKSPDEFSQMQILKLTPISSYRLDANLEVASYIGVHHEQRVLQFYPKTALDWLTLLQNANIANECDAKQAFTTQFDAAKTTLTNSPWGRSVLLAYPELFTAFDEHQQNKTWQHFLDGTYGICTRTGLPDAIFLKQFYVRMIDLIVGQHTPETVPDDIKLLLEKTLVRLDHVEAEFAPHEVTQSSRQRCIIDVRTNYFGVRS